MLVLWTILCIIGTRSSEDLTKMIPEIIDQFESVQFVTIKDLSDQRLHGSFLKSKKYFVNFELDNNPSDIFVIIGECERTLSFYINNENPQLFANLANVILIGRTHCSNLTSKFLQDLVSNSSWALKFWTVYPNEEGTFKVFGISFWSKITGARVIDLGTVPVLRPRMGYLDLTNPDGIELRTTTVGNQKIWLEWDSVVVNNSKNELVMLPGLSTEVFDYVERHSGIKRVLINPTNTWGSYKVHYFLQELRPDAQINYNIHTNMTTV